jgi:transcriptional regulator with XRE-family HTH domain
MTAKELRTKRIAAEISASVLAANARVNRSRLSSIERGYIQPTDDELQRLATTLEGLIEAKAVVDRVAASVVANDLLTAILAERVMGWTVGPDRFPLGGRRWLPRWRFQPVTRLEDAFRLLKSTAPEEYSIGATEDGGFWARVRVDGITGEAREPS